MMRINSVTGLLIFECKAETMRECVREAITAGICLDNADFSNMDLEGVNFACQSLKWCNFENANISNAIIQGCDLSYSSLRRATFRYSNLKGACLRNADLNGANFAGANLQNVDMRYNDPDSGLVMHDKRNLKNVVFIGANMQSAVFERLGFDGCDFMNAVLKNTSMRYVVFENCIVSNVDFSISKLHKISISNCTLTNCTFWDVDMTKCEIHSCDISNSYLGYATISLNCGFRNNKTSEAQRTFIASFLYKWLVEANDLSDYEKELKSFLSGYASNERYNNLQIFANGRGEFKSYVETKE